MLASWQSGLGSLPDHLGLEPEDCTAMMHSYFRPSGMRLPGITGRRPADYTEMLERDDLEAFLLAHAAPGDQRERCWMAGILVAGCLGRDHLWQDLGLWSRSDLTALIAFNFPKLHEMNDRNMRWKKFLYKRLCESDGIYVCRSPSCGECVDHADCFPSASPERKVDPRP